MIMAGMQHVWASHEVRPNSLAREGPLPAFHPNQPLALLVRGTTPERAASGC